jgi:inactivated superfamily I helicase
MTRIDCRQRHRLARGSTHGKCGLPLQVGRASARRAARSTRRAAAWDDALAQFAALHAIESRLTRSDALQALRSLMADTLFQPEVPRAPIQILGLLEAAGQPFDALWVTGLAAESWPAAPQPNPAAAGFLAAGT